MEMERKDADPKVIQPLVNKDAELNERTPQSSANKAMDKRELLKQTQKQENLTMMRWGYISRKPDRVCYFQHSMT